MPRCQGLEAFIYRVIKVKGTDALALKRLVLSDSYLLRNLGYKRNGTMFFENIPAED
jgi:hypothetical protein